MKKFVIGLLFMVATSTESYAIYPDLTPLSAHAPQICGQCTAEQLQTLKSAVEFVQQASSREGQKQMFNDVEAHAKKYATKTGKDIFNKYKGKFKKEKSGEDKPISYTRMIKKTKTNVEDVNAVQEAFKKYFLYVPSDNEEIQASYKEKREQFVEDTTLELYITAKEMDNELKAMLTQLDLIQKCLIENKSEECKGSGMEDYNCQKGKQEEDEMCYRRNALIVASIYDTIMKYNEYLLAMRAQYEAVRTLGQGVQPKEYKKSKKSALSSYFEESFGFASQEPDEDDESLIIDKIPESDFDITNEVHLDVEIPFSDKKGDMEALVIFQKAQDHISKAIESHNLKQQLPEFKNVFDAYHDTEKVHNKALSQVITSQQCVLKYLAKRYSDSEKVWLDNCRVDNKEGYICKYDPAKPATDKEASKGLYDVLCPDDPSQKCYKLAPNSYSEIGGMSGWLINMYLNAKDELSDMTPESDDYVIGVSSLEVPHDRSAGANTGAYSAENLKYQFDGDELLIDKYKENMRVLSRLGHSIGITANEEINKDTNGTAGASKFGVSTKPFVLWNDQKNFYNQYVDGKYHNISEYISVTPLFKNILDVGLKINETYEYEPLRNENGTIIKTVEVLRKEAKDAINKLLEGLAVDDYSETTELEKILAKEKETLQNVTNAHMQKLGELNKQRIALYKQLEKVNVRQAELNDEITKQDSVINYSEGYNARAEEGVEMDAKYQTPGNPHKTFASSLQANIEKQKTKESAAEEAREKAVAELGDGASQEEILKAVNAKEREIKNARKEYVLAYYNAEQKYKRDLDNFVAERKLSAAQEAVQLAISEFPVLKEAELVVQYIKDYALKVVRETSEQIELLKTNDENSIYYAANNAKVLQIHTDMLKKITEPKLEDIVKDLNLNEDTAKMLAKYATLFTGAFSDICDGVSCYEPDEKYFVGLIAQKKDFAAPKAAVDFSSAPMREMFYFGLEDLDYIDNFITDDLKLIAKDYDIIVNGIGVGAIGIRSELKIKESAVGAGKDVDISNDQAKILLLENSLPDSGIEMPEIWRIVLSYRPFVQKDIDLDKFLNHGSEGTVASRSGLYPCFSDGKIIDLNIGSEAGSYGILSALPAGYTNLPECQAIKSNGSEYIDVEPDEDINKIGNMTNFGIIPTDGASELGTILTVETYKPIIVGENGLPIVDAMGLEVIAGKTEEIKYLTFRPQILLSLKRLAKVQDEKDLTADYYMFKRVLPQNSQFSDYLNKMDIERMALDSKIQIRNKIYSANVNDLVIVNSLYKAFAAMGYDFDRASFDLSNDSYYRQAENVLNARKEDNIRLAKELLNGKISLTSEEMENRKKDLLHQIEVLEFDKDEKVNVVGTESIEELAESIKNKEADNALLEKNRVSIDVQREEPVYCSIYGE